MLAHPLELLATPVADAQKREALARLADEQAALRRVATLVAEGAAPGELFAAVADEVAAVIGVTSASVSRFLPDGFSVVLASLNDPGFPIGSRWRPDEGTLNAAILATGRPVRIDQSAMSGPIAEASQVSDVRSVVGVPIVVDGKVWGMVAVGRQHSDDPLPADTEVRLTDFTELIATAIANAQSRDDVLRLADEQAALRRVATLVAEGVPSAELFSAVTKEVAGVFSDVDPSLVASVIRFDPGPESVLVGASRTYEREPLGSRWVPKGKDLYVSTRVLRTRSSARVDQADLDTVGGPDADVLRLRGFLYQVGCPVVVEGQLWGAMCLNSKQELPPGTDDRLESFTGLVATAIANAESREAISHLADEQAALRRVATLVAEGTAPTALFAAVAVEVAAVVGVSTSSVSRFLPDGSSVVLASHNDPGFPVGSRWQPEEGALNAVILEGALPARIDHEVSSFGSIAEAATTSDVRFAVGAPIVVEGTVWGMVAVGRQHSDEPLPPQTEMRLAAFTELIATAIANAESREAINHLADEQAALRRVATLVARDASSTEVFEAVATEVGRLLDIDITVVGRYDGDGAATAIGSWSASGGGVPVGTRSAVGGNNVLTIVAETGRPARVEGYDDASGEAADIARRHGWRSSIAAPIIVESRLWGVMLVATQRPEPFPAGAEERLSAFTDLVATALANAQAHDEVLRFGEEQAALGRVATLVAAGAAPEQVFTAVVDEASSLLGLKMIEFVRYDGEDTGTVIAASGDHPFPPGSTWSLEDPSVMATVARTARAARIDDYGALDGEIARVARTASFQSAIGAPLTVEGHLWGVIIAISTDPDPISERSEARLAQFTGLVATAVANAEARQALEGVAAEQATLRRIATLVARGAQPEEVFAAVAEETASTFEAVTAVMRFEHDPPGVVLVGVSEESGLPIGTRWGFADGMASAEVYRTGRSARLSSAAEYWTSHGGPVADVADRLGIVSQVSCPIVVEGGVWGVITLNAREELPADTERRLEKFTDLVTTAVANAEGKSELAASRRRIVAAADDARRRIERDLHDGIQQRLVALTLRARAMAREPADEMPGTAAELAEGLKDAFEELREISRGIHPAILTEAGLRPALRALARRSSVPINVDVRVDERLPAPVEAAAYYVASEALTNVAKHAHAKVVELIATCNNGDLTLEIRDDGIGGVDAGRGSGILGLTDRVEALGGTISLASPPGGGTTLSVRLPITT